MAIPGPIRETAAMIAGMRPVLQPGAFVFCSTTDDNVMASALPRALASFHEAEGLSLILPLSEAERFGFATDQPMAMITLTVNSALDGVGLTAAVATALAAKGIPCNMVAAFHHDHVFVPLSSGVAALSCLAGLSTTAI